MESYGVLSVYQCKLCGTGHMDRETLVRHLKTEHEPLEIVSFSALTMMNEQDRDAAGQEFNRRFQGLKKVIGE